MLAMTQHSPSSQGLAVEDVSKRYEIYVRPIDRLLQTACRGRRQFYQEVWALRRVSFAMQPGQALGILGRNGSGKSTLLQLIAGILEPTMGMIRTPGRVSALLELGSGFNPEFTGRENIYLNGAILGLSQADVRDRFAEIVAFADIGEYLEQPLKSYSSGMAMRLAFAVAAAVTPRVLIVDEALAVGDEAFQRKCFARIEAVRSTGAIVLFVSHSSQQILEICDTALLLDHGHVIAHGSPRTVVNDYHRLLYGNARGTISASVAASTAPDADRVPGDHARPSTEYGSQTAEISNVKLTTLDGLPATVLRRGDQYLVSYVVRFHVTARSVRFGMMVKTDQGVELGGGTLPQSNVGAGPFERGRTVQLTFRFRCHLLPGTYSLNTGLTGDTGGNHAYLHRLVDAVRFNVVSDATDFHAGYTDFGVTARISQCDSDALQATGQ